MATPKGIGPADHDHGVRRSLPKLKITASVKEWIGYYQDAVAMIRKGSIHRGAPSPKAQANQRAHHGGSGRSCRWFSV
jgi:hypothetical protein